MVDTDCQHIRIQNHPGDSCLDRFINAFLGWVKLRRKTNAACGWLHSIEWDPGLDQDEKNSPAPAFIFLCLPSVEAASPKLLSCRVPNTMNSSREPKERRFLPLVALRGYFCQGNG